MPTNGWSSTARQSGAGRGGAGQEAAGLDGRWDQQAAGPSSLQPSTAPRGPPTHAPALPSPGLLTRGLRGGQHLPHNERQVGGAKHAQGNLVLRHKLAHGGRHVAQQLRQGQGGLVAASHGWQRLASHAAPVHASTHCAGQQLAAHASPAAARALTGAAASCRTLPATLGTSTEMIRLTSSATMSMDSAKSAAGGVRGSRVEGLGGGWGG